MLSLGPLGPWRLEPSHGRAGPRLSSRAFTKAPVRSGSRAGPGRLSRTLCRGRGAGGGRGRCRAEGLWGCVSLHSRVPGKPPRGAERKIRKRDAGGRGPGRPLGGGGQGADGTAAVLWFRAEIVRGRRRRQAVLEAAASSGFRGKRGRELMAPFACTERRRRPSEHTRRAAESPRRNLYSTASSATPT